MAGDGPFRVLHTLWMIAWQAGLLALAALVLARAGRRAPAAWRHALWMIVVVKFLVPPTLTVPVPNAPLPLAASVHGVGGTVSTPVGGEAAGPAAAVAWLLVCLWLAGVVVSGAVLLVRLAKQGSLVRAARPVAGGRADLLSDAACRLGVRRPPRLLVSDRVQGPMLVGLFRPALLLPPGAPALPEGDLRAILLHELAHLRRRDLLSLWIEQAARLLFYFHPMLWLAGSALRYEREAACDELVLRLAGIGRREYASGYVAALRMASSGVRHPVALAMVEPLEVEKQRIRRILHGDLPMMSARWSAALLPAATLGLFTVARTQPPPDTVNLAASPVAYIRPEPSRDRSRPTAGSNRPPDLAPIATDGPAARVPVDAGTPGTTGRPKTDEPHTAVPEAVSSGPMSRPKPEPAVPAPKPTPASPGVTQTAMSWAQTDGASPVRNGAEAPDVSPVRQEAAPAFQQTAGPTGPDSAQDGAITSSSVPLSPGPSPNLTIRQEAAVPSTMAGTQAETPAIALGETPPAPQPSLPSR